MWTEWAVETTCAVHSAHECSGNAERADAGAREVQAVTGRLHPARGAFEFPGNVGNAIHPAVCAAAKVLNG